MTLIYATRLQALRSVLQQNGLDGFIVPMGDEYQSEDVPESDRRIHYLSGFTGSAAVIIVLADRALFCTDSRYTLQAHQQIAKHLFEVYEIGEKSLAEIVQEHLFEGNKIGFDPRLHTVSSSERLDKAIKTNGAKLVAITGSNPVDTIWLDRPQPPITAVVPQGDEYTGDFSSAKRGKIAAQLAVVKLDAAIIADPTSVAWLLNVRGSDTPYTPVPLSRAIIYNDGRVDWFIDPRKIPNQSALGLKKHLGNQVQILDISLFVETLRNLGNAKARIRVAAASTPLFIMEILRQAGAIIDQGDDPCSLPRACKNATELTGMRAAHLRDGVALVRLLAWLDRESASGNLTEIGVAEKLESLRAISPLYRGASFATIAGFAANGAIIHYSATPETNTVLEAGSLFLLDSGGQYPDGTTDVTRTVAIGKPCADMCENFTRVLQGHIALATVRFPSGTTGGDLDVLARRSLWAAGLDYGHGTGHGVGCYLTVHEGPHAISRGNRIPLQAGMIVSNEPGYYKANHYGIRIESLQTVVEVITAIAEQQQFFGFETLTLAPIDRRLIVTTMLGREELAWINTYHAKVRRAIMPELDAADAAWLLAATEEIRLL